LSPGGRIRMIEADPDRVLPPISLNSEPVARERCSKFHAAVDGECPAVGAFLSTPLRMQRVRLAPLSLLVPLAVIGCDGGPTDTGLGPDGQVIPTECGTSNTVSLVPGESWEFRGTLARYFCLETDSEGPEDFVLVVYSGDQTPTTAFSVLTENTTSLNFPLLAPPPGAPSESGGTSTAGDHERPVPDHHGHMALREQEIRDLGPLIGSGAGSASPAPRAPSAPVPALGDIMRLNAQANPEGIQNGACEIPLWVDARVMAVSQKAIVVADTLNPGGGFTATDYQSFGNTFDSSLAPLAEQYFGTPTDLDGNGRTILLFTREVNRLTPPDVETFTAGFFFARDLFPKQGGGGFGSCTYSNEAEILYLMVPDPQGTVSSPRSRSFVLDFTPSTIIHEYQHLINAAERLYRQPVATGLEVPWLNEGLSHIAEELLFYQSTGLSPGMNIRPRTLDELSPFGWNNLNRHQRFNFLRFFDHFLPQVDSHSALGPGTSLATRGAIWNFLRYAADRKGGDQSAFFRSMIGTTTTGAENLASALGGASALHDWMSDWRVAIYADDRVPGLDPRHRDRSWHLPGMYARIKGPGTYPIKVELPASDQLLSGELAGGGASYLRFGVDSAQKASIQVTSSGGLPPAYLRATLLRTR